MYKYTADSPEQAKENVTKYAGRVNGGDFKFTFTSADDTSYAVNTELMAKKQQKLQKQQQRQKKLQQQLQHRLQQKPQQKLQHRLQQKLLQKQQQVK